jgi:hypothetical protein
VAGWPLWLVLFLESTCTAAGFGMSARGVWVMGMLLLLLLL